MRPVQFQADRVVALLRRKQIATIEQLKAALGTSVDMTVFRKLREIRYHTSYSHRGRYYALDEVARFDERGLWTCRDIHFSRWGSLVDTVERFVNDAEQGLFASELAPMVQVDVEGPLLGLVRKQRLAREKVSGAYLYCARDSARRRAQILARELGPPSEQQQRRDLVLDQSKAALVLLLSTWMSANAGSSPVWSRCCSAGEEIDTSRRSRASMFTRSPRGGESCSKAGCSPSASGILAADGRPWKKNARDDR